MNEVSSFLNAIEHSDPRAAAKLLLVYDELRKLAAGHVANEDPGHTLNATASVHEAYLRLVGDQQFDHRGHSFAAGAEAVRRILVEYARARSRGKRGGERVRIELLDRARHLAEDPDLLLSLDELLIRLGEDDPLADRVAHLHLLRGLSVEEAGDVLGLSRAVAYRNWKFARVRLREPLEE